MSEDCWYRAAAHRPTFATCPATCAGTPVAGEHMGDGVERTYCDLHASWRRRTAPHALVHRLKP